MSVRGIIGQINREMKRIERENARRERVAEKALQAAIKEEERARKANEMATKRLSRASAADRKRLEKEAGAAYVASMQSQAERKNLELAEIYDEIDSILEATLDVDDYVDLESLRLEATHPPFDPKGLDAPIPAPKLLAKPAEPKLVELPEPSWIQGLLFRKKHELKVASVHSVYKQERALWEKHLVRWDSENRARVEKHALDEEERLLKLEKAQEAYRNECIARNKEAAEHNAAVDELIAGLGYGAVDAVQEYVSIVLSNSVYPNHFPVTHDFAFDPNTAELKLKVSVPAPDSIPGVKAYKYTRSADEITSTSLSQKACRDRYESAIHQVALRSLHEIFEADRRGIIHAIDLQVGTETNVPSTGLTDFIPFVAVACERDRFMEFNLSAVVPSATLELLGAVVSKKPFELMAISASGVRRS